MRVLECPRCKASFESIEPGQTKVTCHFCRFTTDIRDITEGGSDALLRRGMLLVEYADFSAAIQVFDQALNLAPENAYIYVGRLLAEVRLEKESWLGNHNVDLNRYPSYKKALRFADSELRQRLELYNVQVQERLAEIAKRHEEDKVRAEKEQRRREEEVAKREAELAAEHERIGAEEAEKRRRNRPKRIIFTVLIITALVGFFLLRWNRRLDQFEKFTDFDYVIMLLNNDTHMDDIEVNLSMGHVASMHDETPIGSTFGYLNLYFENSILVGVTLSGATVFNDDEILSEALGEELSQIHDEIDIEFIRTNFRGDYRWRIIITRTN